MYNSHASLFYAKTTLMRILYDLPRFIHIFLCVHILDLQVFRIELSSNAKYFQRISTKIDVFPPYRSPSTMCVVKYVPQIKGQEKNLFKWVTKLNIIGTFHPMLIK